MPGTRRRGHPDKKRRTSLLSRKLEREAKKQDIQSEKVEVAAILVAKLKMSKIEVLTAYDNFHKTYPKGEISKQNFLDLDENKGIIWAEALFRVFDKDRSGALNFYEFMLVKQASCLESPQEKLNWIFTAFDRDGGGSIDIDEVTDVVVGLYKMSGKDEDEDEIDDLVDEIMEAVDENSDGKITKLEFLENAMKSEFIQNLIKPKDEIIN